VREHVCVVLLTFLSHPGRRMGKSLLKDAVADKSFEI
jgi:hypothetical protein